MSFTGLLYRKRILYSLSNSPLTSGSKFYGYFYSNYFSWEACQGRQMQSQSSSWVPSENESLSQPGWCYRMMGVGRIGLSALFVVSVLTFYSQDEENLTNFNQVSHSQPGFNLLNALYTVQVLPHLWCCSGLNLLKQVLNLYPSETHVRGYGKWRSRGTWAT
jgi:hypothetical protein